MLKILQVRLQQYLNQELLDVQTGFRRGRGTRDQIANILWLTAKAKEFKKKISLCFIDYLYAEYIMRNAWLDEAQTGIKIARRNINNLRYADDTTLWQKVK